MTKRFSTPGPRALHPDLCGDARLAKCSLGAQLLYDRLVLQADDQGRLHGLAHVVKAVCFPLAIEVSEKKVRTWLAEVAANGLVELYSAGGIELIQVKDWWENEAGMRRAYPSHWPAPPGWTDNVYGVPKDTRPGNRADGASDADSAGKVPRSAANRPGKSASACAGACAYAGSAPAEPSRPASTEAKPSTHQQFVAFWCAEFERIKGAPYGFQGAKDGAHSKAILEFAGGDLDLAKARARTLLNSGDPFYREKGVDLGTLRSQWNKLGSAGQTTSTTASQPRGAAYQTFVPPDPEA